MSARKIPTAHVLILIGVVVIIIVACVGLQNRIYLICFGDSECIKHANNLERDCVPADIFLVFNEDIGNVTIYVNITRVGDDCIIHKEVTDADIIEGEAAPLFNITCESPLVFDGERCSHPLYEELGVPTEGGEGSGDGGVHISYSLICGPDDLSCKMRAVQLIHDCSDSRILDTGRIWTPISYWTKDITVTNEGDTCHLHILIADVVNKPPEIPDIEGWTLDCTFPTLPLSENPVEDLTLDWCFGDLFEFIYD